MGDKRLLEDDIRDIAARIAAIFPEASVVTIRVEPVPFQWDFNVTLEGGRG